MSTIKIEISQEIYTRLEEQARQVGKMPEELGRELLETSIQICNASASSTVREVLHAKGQMRPLRDSLRRKIIPGVTLDEVRESLKQAAGLSLSEIISTQRG